jgi:hypothetical protein
MKPEGARHVRVPHARFCSFYTCNNTTLLCCFSALRGLSCDSAFSLYAGVARAFVARARLWSSKHVRMR